MIIHFYVESGQKLIQFNIQFKIESKIFIQKIIHSNWKNKFKTLFNSKLNQKYSFKLEKQSQLEKTVKNMQKWAVFSSKHTFYSFFLWISHFFDSFKNSFNSTAKIVIQRIYSFNSSEKYSFKECIHSKNNQIIHSMKIFIFFKNAVPPTPRPAWPLLPHWFWMKWVLKKRIFYKLTVTS